MPKEPLLAGCKFMRIHPNKTRHESLLKNVCIPLGARRDREAVPDLGEGGEGFCCWDLPAEIARPTETANPPAAKR